jgi:predicted transcriptional regulator of viral defense system
MKFLELKTALNGNFFSFVDVLKNFPLEDDNLIKTQLARFVRKKLIVKIKKGFYCFNPNNIDQLELAAVLYQPSYISLETALYYYGMIPDIPQNTTSVTPITTKKIETCFGSFFYSKINQRLFFAYRVLPGKEFSLTIAEKEKALLDFVYLRRLSSLKDLRIDRSVLNNKKLNYFVNSFPKWVKKVLDE